MCPIKDMNKFVRRERSFVNTSGRGSGITILCPSLPGTIQVHGYCPLRGLFLSLKCPNLYDKLYDQLFQEGSEV